VLRTDAAHEATHVEFDADGTALRGWLYRPRGRAAAAPAVVMAHGYNCIKELYLDRYAAAVADAGHVVLAYDHRNFGESDGEPRQELDPWMQVRDYRNAITFVQTLDGVDRSRQDKPAVFLLLQSSSRPENRRRSACPTILNIAS